MCKGDMAGLHTEKNNAIPLRRHSSGGKHFDAPEVPAAIALAGEFLIARLSAAVTIHRMAHGGVAIAGRVATCLNPVEPVADFPPQVSHPR